MSAITTYYYAFRATNATASVWAQPSWQFTTLSTNLNCSVDAYGIPDLWKESYVLIGVDRDGLADPDGDGMNNQQEYLAGTAPTNAASVLAMQNIVQPAGNMAVVSWQSVDTKFYRIQRSTNLMDSWSIIQSNLSATAPLNIYTDTPPASVKGMFYKVNLEE